MNCTDTLRFELSLLSNIEQIMDVYRFAAQYQLKNGYNVWFKFDQDIIENEIANKRHYSIFNRKNELAAVFFIALSDPIIWRDFTPEPAIYLHRIATHPNFKGQGIMRNITAWANKYAVDQHLKYIRMDTWADNPTLIQYYEHCGYTILDNSFVPIGSGLPDHYENITVTLFQRKIVENVI